MAIGEQIRKLRENNNHTVREFAEKAGVSERSVREWESGEIRNPRPESLQKICGAFHISMEELFPAPAPEPCVSCEPALEPQTQQEVKGVIQRWRPHEGHRFTKPYTSRNGRRIGRV